MLVRRDTQANIARLTWMNALTILALLTGFVKMASILTHAVAQTVSEVVIARRILTIVIPIPANIMVSFVNVYSFLHAQYGSWL